MNHSFSIRIRFKSKNWNQQWQKEIIRLDVFCSGIPMVSFKFSYAFNWVSNSQCYHPDNARNRGYIGTCLHHSLRFERTSKPMCPMVLPCKNTSDFIYCTTLWVVFRSRQRLEFVNSSAKSEFPSMFEHKFILQELSFEGRRKPRCPMNLSWPNTSDFKYCVMLMVLFHSR